MKGLKETDTLTLPLLKRAVKTLKSHRAINQESNLTPEQWEKLRQGFNLFMERNKDNEELREYMGRPI